MKKSLLFMLTLALAIAACKNDDEPHNLIYGRWYQVSQDSIARHLKDGTISIKRDTFQNSQEYLVFTRDRKALSPSTPPGTFSITSDSLIIKVRYGDVATATTRLKYRISANELTTIQSSSTIDEVIERSWTYRKR